MKSSLHVGQPPVRPLILYDGECRFCCFWITRWQRATGPAVDYLPYQDECIATRYPELPREQLEAAVHLIESDGSVYSRAEAVFRALAVNPNGHWWRDWYEHSPGFARATEWGYGFIARHREFFSQLTRLFWGRAIEPPSYQLSRGLFLRSLGIIYLIAFLSFWLQLSGLIGSNGILPASRTMSLLRQGVTAQHIGLDRYHLLPTLCWITDRDWFLNCQCAAGAITAGVLVIGFLPVPCLIVLWILYLSLVTISNEFLGFQWDNLLLETGFLAIFLAPLQALPKLRFAPPPSGLVLWLFRWLLFRLMFESGCVKLLSGDPTWRNLTALKVHYETQPLPTWIGWYAHQLPAWAQKSSTALMFGIELFVPFLIFAPRRLRHFASIALIALQLLILLTGNYCFFNLLTIALCLLLFEDSALWRIIPEKWRARLQHQPQPMTGRQLHWPRQITVPLFCLTLTATLVEGSLRFGARLPGPRPVLALVQWLAPLRTFNNYGLFAVMTTTRPEIIVQGSMDGENWSDYEFKYKPGELKRRPRFVEPHQPRLDWQMWFAALSNYQQNRWFVSFCIRLLQGSPEVLRLLEHNPFPSQPPRYVRALVYEYHFTDLATRHRTGAWWRRDLKGTYLPAIGLQETPAQSR